MSDLISRLSELRCQYNCFDENERDAYHTLSEAIKAISAQRTGRWIKHEVKLFNGCHTGRYFDECSECGKLTTEWRKVTEYQRWNFCPNCGARMEEEDGNQS